MKPILANIALCILLINSNVTITSIFKFNKNPSNYSPNSRGFLKTILWLLQTSTTLLMSYKFNFQNVYSTPENSVEWIITPFVSDAPARKKFALYVEYFRLRLPNFFNSENSYIISSKKNALFFRKELNTIWMWSSTVAFNKSHLKSIYAVWRRGSEGRVGGLN